MLSKKIPLIFPKGFLWGTATAGHQVEGNNVHSDWWLWEKEHKDIENSGIASDHYNQFKKDLRLAKNKLHNNAYRFSIEWARVEPKEGKFDKKEAKHYRTVLKQLNKLKMKSMVTLNHFVIPLWFYKKGGWERKENIKYFERYVSFCVENFGDLIEFWITFNEPNVYVGMAYLQGAWPPQKKSYIFGLKAYINMISAHKKAYNVIRKHFSKALVGAAINVAAFRHFGALDLIPVKIEKSINNFSFLDLCKRHYNFVGINYYTIHINKLSHFLYRKEIASKMKKHILGKYDVYGSPVYPKGIYDVSKSVWKKYHLPIYITENGTADAHEQNRVRYILKHLKWLNRAIKEGVDVRGYFYWSLLDNFEWHLGKSVRFGLFEVDYKTLKRKPRKSAMVYGEIAKANSINS